MCIKQKKNRQYSPTNVRHHMFHMYRTKHKTQYRHPLTSTSTRVCHLCKKPWTPITIHIKNKYINLHDLLRSKGYISGQQQNNPFLSSTVDHKSNGQLRTNSSITSPPNAKSQKRSVVQKLVYKTPPHYPTDSSTDQTCNEGNSFDTKDDIVNSTGHVISKYV